MFVFVCVDRNFISIKFFPVNDNFFHALGEM